MQDIHSTGSGGGGRLFGGGGDRRLRPHQNHAHLQALKCPRCDSLNTKFCYYNNYNLSQPRHFCKSCRRYWTKGGVLRNVPVGGGCRKTKRSKPKAASSEAPPPPRERKNKSSNSQNSSSDSSSLTANTTSATATTATAAAEVLSGSSSNSAPTLLSFAEHQSTRSLFSIMNPQSTSSIRNPSLQDPASAEENGMFPEIGTLTSLMSDPVGFNIGDISCFRLSNEQGQAAVVEDPRLNNNQQWMGPEQVSGAGFVDQAAEMEYSALQGGALEWPGGSGGGDQGLFDLTGSVDQSYWNQAQWSDQDHQVLNYQLP